MINESGEIQKKAKEIIATIRKDKKTLILVFFSIVLILSLFISELTSKNESKDTKNNVESLCNQYCIDKREVENFLKKVKGVGDVEIIITYDTSKEYIYAYDETENSKSRNIDESDINIKKEHIIVKDDGNEKGLMIKEIYPVIRGVAVVCDGGNNPLIKEQITEILSALFDINTKSISVAAAGS